MEQERTAKQRCRCNKLLYVQMGDKIYIKCNKCKRVLVVHTNGVRKIEYENAETSLMA